MFLENSVIRLRPLEPEDLDFLYKWENDSSLWCCGNTVAPYSKFMLRQYIELSTKDFFEINELRLVVETKEDKRAVGLIDLFNYDAMHSRAEIAILTYAQTDRRKGIASSAMQLLIDYAFNVLLLHQVYCEVNKSNTDSLSIMQKAGFTISGTKQQWNKTAAGWEDVIMLQKINQ